MDAPNPVSAITARAFSDIMTQHPCGGALAVAVSGGADSMALFVLLHGWAETNARKVHVLTVDHGLRPESAAEAQQVKTFVATYPHATHQTLIWQGEKPQTKIQESARHARYDLMADYCEQNSIKDLFLAHHADDQLETILFRLAKGSGLDGLCGMRHIVAFDDTLTLHRPLLGMEKHALMATCAAHNAPIVHDPSNHNPAYARPRLRQALAEEGLSVKRLVKTTERLQRAQTALDHYAQDFVLNHCVKSDGYRIDIHQLKSTPFEIVVRVMKVLMDEINPDHSARMEKVETLCETVVNDQDFKKATLGGVIFAVDHGAKRLSMVAEHPCTGA